MKKIIRKTMAAAGMVLLLAGCNASASMEEYYMPVKNSTAPVTLTLNEDKQTFQLSIPQSKKLPYGSYTIKGDIMTCKSYDDTMVFRFKVVDDNTLKFIAKGSTESIVDGGTFTKSDSSTSGSN